MITPNDIATKDFKKVAVGYSPEEVDTFLDDIYEDYEKLYKESQKEKSKTEAVAEDTDRLKHLEKSIERTLSLAEAAAEETKAAAKADGDAIINSAKQQAEDILASARTKAYELEQKISGLESRYELMKTRIKLLLYAEIELLDKGEVLAEKEAKAQEIKNRQAAAGSSCRGSFCIMQKSSERVIEYDTDFDNDTADFIRPGDKALGIRKPEADSQHDGGGRLSGFDVCGKQRGCLRDALRAEVADSGADRRNCRCADLFLPHTAEKEGISSPARGTFIGAFGGGRQYY